jgi:GAF domain-containing protein
VGSVASHIDPEALRASLESNRRSPPEADPEKDITRVLLLAATIFGVSGLGLMLLDPEGGQLRYVASTDEAARDLERSQEEVGQGPCVEAFIRGSVVGTQDLLSDDRWPRLKGRLSKEGIRAVLGLPTVVSGETVGTLNAYSIEPHPWDESDIGALRAYNEVLEGRLGGAMLADNQGRLVGQLRSALQRRATIERAIGFIMGGEGVDPVAAFDRMRVAARSSRRPVADVASEVLEGRIPPEVRHRT